MPIASMSETEILSYLPKTSLPTVLVEGTDDANIYRWIESKIGIFNADFLACSGRDVLISIYNKRNEFKHGKLAWVADLDMWRYSNPPDALNGIIFTSGYSIENDLYDGSNIELLFEPVELVEFRKILTVVCEWFAFEVLEYQAGRPHLVSTHVNQVVDYKLNCMNKTFKDNRRFIKPDQNIVDSILDNYKLSLRGKTLYETAVHILSHPKRLTKYSRSALMEICLKLYPDNPHMLRIVKTVQEHISLQ